MSTRVTQITLYPGARLIVRPAGCSGYVIIEHPLEGSPMATVHQTGREPGACFPFQIFDPQALADELAAMQAGPNLADIMDGQAAGDVSDE